MSSSWTLARALCLLAPWAAFICHSKASSINVNLPREFHFERHEVAIGTARHHTLLEGFFSGGPVADLAVASVDVAGSRHLRLHCFDGTNWVARSGAKLAPGLLFFDRAKIGGRDRLLACHASRVNWIDPETGRETLLAPLPEGYPLAVGEWLPHIDITLDLNQDGRDDLVLPNFDGFWIALQAEDGSFPNMVKFGPPEPFRNQRALGAGSGKTYGEAGLTVESIPWLLSRLRQLDANHDGRMDLAFWNQNHFDIHVQEPSGQFATAPERLATDVPFDSDGGYSLAFGFKGAGPVRLLLGLRRKSEQTALLGFWDVNGDRLADMVTQTVGGRGLLRQKSVYKIYRGLPGDRLASFNPTPATVAVSGNAAGLKPWGYSSELFQDFNGDGKLDLMTQHVKISAWGMVRAMAGHSIAIDIEIRRQAEGAFPAKPSASLKVRPKLALLGSGVFFPPVLVGDVGGDGLPNLLVGTSPGELRIFDGIPYPKSRELYSQTLATPLPDNERMTWLADMNGDARLDIVICHPPSEGRCAILISLPPGFRKL